MAPKVCETSSSMDLLSGRSNAPTAVLTREVRWFFDGPLPTAMLNWFTSTPSHLIEHRIDCYDMAAAREGVGRKKRDTQSLDSKYQILGAQFVPLAPGLAGNVEDWLKISRPLADWEIGSRPDWIDVHKHLYTRRYLLDGDLEVGCEVELVEIEAAGHRAWSFCFETFGSPALRQRALRAGIDQVMESTPTPDGVEFDHESCHNYPEWLSLLADGEAHAVERVKHLRITAG